MISGRVVGKEIGQNGNIKVITEYTLTDGSKKAGSARYNFKRFSAEIVEADIIKQCKYLMIKAYGLKRHQELLATDLSTINHEMTSVEIIITPAVYDENDVEITPAVTLIIDDK